MPWSWTLAIIAAFWCQPSTPASSLVFVKKAGPEVRLQVRGAVSSSDGDITLPLLSEAIFRTSALRVSSISCFAVDSYARILYVVTPGLNVTLTAVDLGSACTSYTCMKPNILRRVDVGLRNVWGVVWWNSKAKLVAVAPSNLSAFHTTVLEVDPITGESQALGSVGGTPSPRVSAVVSNSDTYFFLVARRQGKYLVRQHLIKQTHVAFSHSDFAHLVHLAFDDSRGRLLGIITSSLGTRVVRIDQHTADVELIADINVAPMYRAALQGSFEAASRLAVMDVNHETYMIARDLQSDLMLTASSMGVRVTNEPYVVGLAVLEHPALAVSQIQPSLLGVASATHMLIYGRGFGYHDESPSLTLTQRPAVGTRVQIAADDFHLNNKWGTVVQDGGGQQITVILPNSTEVDLSPGALKQCRDDTTCIHGSSLLPTPRTILNVIWTSDTSLSAQAPAGADIGKYSAQVLLRNSSSNTVLAQMIESWQTFMPTLGTMNGGSDIMVTGRGFSNTTLYLCSWHGFETSIKPENVTGTARVLSFNTLICPSPSLSAHHDHVCEGFQCQSRLALRLFMNRSQTLRQLPGPLHAPYVRMISGKPSSAIMVQSPSILVPASNATFKIAIRDSFGLNIFSNVTVHATVSAQDPQQDLGQLASESVNGVAVFELQIPSRRFEVSFGSGGLNSSCFGAARGQQCEGRGGACEGRTLESCHHDIV